MATTRHVVVEARKPHWHAGFRLEPNTLYLIFPSPQSRYSIDGEAHASDFQGGDWMDGTTLAVPAPLRLGGLAVLVWHHQADGSATPRVLTFPAGKGFEMVATRPEGGSMHFLIADRVGAYADNHGTCEVDVVPTDAGHVQLLRTLCDSYDKLYSTEFEKVVTRCGIEVAVGALAGVARGSGQEGAIIWGGVAWVASKDCRQAVHDVITATQECLNDHYASHHGRNPVRAAEAGDADGEHDHHFDEGAGD